MFVVSMKASKKNILVWAVVLIVIIILAGFLIFSGGSGQKYAVTSVGKYNLTAGTNADRLAFLAQFGWKVTEDPVEIAEVIIPQTFNDTYQKYNDLQKQQGLDLTKYASKRCKRWTYAVTNFPGKSSGVRANILVLDDKVIGGDVSSVELNGFMYGFEGKLPGTGSSAAASSAAASEQHTEAQPTQQVDLTKLPADAWPSD